MGVDAHGDLQRAVAHEILDDAREAALEDQAAAIGVAKIMQAVVLRQQHLALLDRCPLMADVLRRAANDESAGEQPEAPLTPYLINGSDVSGASCNPMLFK